MDLNPISLLEIEAFQRLFGKSLRPWEAMAICEMDDAYRAAVEDTRPARTPDGKEAMKATPTNVRSFFSIMRKGKQSNVARPRNARRRGR